MSPPTQSPLRWAICEVEELKRYIAAQQDKPVSAEWENNLRHAHLAADEAEEIRATHEVLVNEHMALRLALGSLIKSAKPREGVQPGSEAHMTFTLRGSDLGSARQILANLSTP